MKKYTTKPIDFTGCHPVIAEHLKRGEIIQTKSTAIDVMLAPPDYWRYELCGRVMGVKQTH